MFDYEHAAAMHHWNGRLATRVLVPAAIPEGALARYGIRPPKLVRYPGLKEEYYLADHELDVAGVTAELGLDPGRLVTVVRPPPEVTLYHRGASTDLFAAVLARLLDAAPQVQTVVLPRTADQREALMGGAAIVPDRPVDGPSLVAAADLVVSAGGTMNREAAALGVPAWTPFAARLGAVDRRLIAEGRLRRLEDPADLVLERRERTAPPPLRNPETLIDLILEPGVRRLHRS
jgi:predicted glycosyltransferase